MSKKLTKEQQLYIDKQLEFTEELYNKADEQLKEVYKAQLSNRSEILTEIANTMLSYNIADSKLAISIVEKKKLKEKLSKVIKDKIQQELGNETKLTDGILKSTGKEKYNTNNYLYSLGVDYNLKPVDNDTLEKIINVKVEEKTWSDRLWDNKNSLQKDLKLEIEDFLNGKTSVNEIEAKIKKKYNSNAYNTKRLVQDNVARVQEGMNDIWREEHNIKRVLYMATLCHNTCGNCGQYDGKDYPVDKKPILLPQHPFCHCTYVNIPNENWRPKMRMNNETKEKINWQSYQEWKVNKPLIMNLQLFAKKSNWEILQEQAGKGLIDLNEAKKGMDYWEKSISKQITTPIEKIKYSKKSLYQYWHILEDHKEFLKPSEIDNIIISLKNPDEIRLSFGKNVYIKNINGNNLITIVNNDIITAYYPTSRYLENNIRKKELVWQK